MTQNTHQNSMLQDATITGEDYTNRYDMKLPTDIGTDYTFKRKIVWFNAIGFLILHLLAVYGAVLSFTSASGKTVVWSLLFGYAGGQGITMGAHRLFTHRTFKATLPLRILALILQTTAGQNCLYIWARDHRQHHKFSDTDADPHNANRGFFFSHVGWLMSRKHPAVISKGKTMDMSDLEADPLVMFQKDHYKLFYVIFAIAIPVSVPMYFWKETLINSFLTAYMLRYVLILNATWLVNSAAHLYGTRPFDKALKPVECKIVSILTVGEGWHNYHHAFPWDYKTSEFGATYNGTATVIEFFEYIGWAYDLKSAPISMAQQRALRTGDGSHKIYRKDNIEMQALLEKHSTHLENATEESTNVEELIDTIQHTRKSAARA